MTDVMAAIRAAGVYGITSLTLTNPADPTTWRYGGESLSLADCVTAEAAIVAALAADVDVPVVGAGGVSGTPVVESPPVAPDVRTVASLLELSHRAHVSYRAALDVGAPASVATVKLVDAQRHRLDADAVDPTHADPAWAEEAPKYPHDDLLNFYRVMLARYGLTVVNAISVP